MRRNGVVACVVLAAGLSGCAAPVSGRHIAASHPAPAATSTTLVGTTADALRADLGNPTLRRIDGPAEVWLYHSRICRLDIIFYPSTAGTPVVSLARPMPRSISSASCLASLEHKRAS